jgi:CRP/FNR family transcriptional activator FtrB
MDAATHRPERGETASELLPISINPDPDDLRTLPIFDGLNEGLVDALLTSCVGLQYRPGSYIVRQGSRMRSLQLVYRGLVDLARIDGDHECGVLLLSTKDLLLPGTALFGEPSLVAARALTTVKVIVLEAEALNLALSESNVLAGNILKAVSGQWRMAVRNILDLNCRTAAQRLAAFLLRLVDLQADSSVPILPIAKRHLATRLGMTAETLSRMLQVVADHGVHVRGRSIIVHDRERAEAFCGPDPYPSRDDRELNVFAL